MALAFQTLALGPLDNRSYVLGCSRTRRAAVIDAGFEPEAVIQAVRAARLELELLLATHGHYDHVAGMRVVQEALGGEFWIHPEDLPFLEHLTAQGASFGFPPAEPPLVTHRLEDGLRLALGDEMLEVIHTPGHSPGGVCFLHGDDLWVGDTLFAGSVGRTDLPGGSFEQLERSIHRRLFTLGDEKRCHCGHGGGTTIGTERLHNPFVGEKARFA
jgi:glyoxylase-like metal-dependent hydrolase (beta-lactamase superfamily II)